ncbi:MAG: hypothetical protein HFJ17_03935 [Clostridia bacterium]|nr:hypothetical protein [Clostridia bacterium]
MKNNLKGNKGITLIALVITIIVLLILAGVAISMLAGDNGILKQAENARKNTEEQSTLEKIKLAATAALTNEEYKIANKEALTNELKAYFNNITEENVKSDDLGYMVTIDGVSCKILNNGEIRSSTELENLRGKKVEKKTVLIDINGEEITIPAEFKIKEDSPNQVNEGIVVVAPDESEFVWVPVTDVNTMYGTDSNGKKLGKIYDFTSTGYKARYWKEEDGVMSYAEGYGEPKILTDTTSGDAVENDTTKGIGLLKSIVGLKETDGDILTQWEERLQNEFDEMIDSVIKNGGFYVGRYETSLRTGNITQSIAKPSNGIATESSAKANTWYGFYRKSKEYSGKNGLDKTVGSSMIWGSQYDQMMIWMQKSGIDVTSNDPSKLKGAEVNQTYIPGNDGDKDVLNNIYDLLGTLYQYTMEAYSTHNRISRRRRCY